VTPKQPRVSGWRPEFLSADKQFDRYSGRLRALVGRSLIEAWTVWVVGDRWFADLPVVLRFDDGTQLEVCWEKFDDLSITWNTIDVGTTPRAWVTWALEWRRNADEALLSTVGGTVMDIRATAFLFETQNAQDPSDRSAAWLTAGLWLTTDRGDLHIFNALDENGLATERPPQDATHDWRTV
jgi:hypothetical protein